MSDGSLTVLRDRLKANDDAFALEFPAGIAFA